MEPILKVENLTKVFSRSGQEAFTAVNGVSFAMKPGECLGIIGESGSGKTTLVNLITRLVDATDGNIYLHGEEITHLKGKALRRVYRNMQMVFQTPSDSFDPRRTLGDGIGESLRNAGMSKKEARSEVKRLLEACGLPAEFADRYPHQVSGGQCQRAAIARALAVKPKLLICDEATSALDVATERKVLKNIIQQKPNKTCIVTTHRPSVLNMCQRVYRIMDTQLTELSEEEAAKMAMDF